jgi:hypothetical protein
VVAAAVKVALQRVGIGLADIKAVTGCDAVAVTDQDGPVSSQQRGGHKNQPKRNDKPAANVHINSVAKNREAGIGIRAKTFRRRTE